MRPTKTHPSAVDKWLATATLILRYALDQIRRAADFDFASCVTVELRELK